jgi:uracil-DNA glycosylase
MNRLAELWKRVDNCEDCSASSNKLNHILGGGKESKPKVMFVFINPTHRNITSSPKYKGPRYPFAGTKEVWKVFFNAGLFPHDLMEQVNLNKWDQELIDSVLIFLRKSGFYFTNVSKCCNYNADLPNSQKIKKGEKLLFEEIEIVRPELIVTFGLIPTKVLTGMNLKLCDCLGEIRRGKDITRKSISIMGKNYPVIPCYFPVGRGNPSKAVEILRHIRTKYM